MPSSSAAGGVLRALASRTSVARRGVTAGAFKKRDFSPVEIACVTERFLREPELEPSLAEVLGEPLTGLHGRDAGDQQTTALQTKHLLTHRVSAHGPLPPQGTGVSRFTPRPGSAQRCGSRAAGTSFTSMKR